MSEVCLICFLNFKGLLIFVSVWSFCETPIYSPERTKQNVWSVGGLLGATEWFISFLKTLAVQNHFTNAGSHR